MTKKVLVLGAAVIGLTATGAQAADVLNPGTGVPYELTSTVYTQDFNTLKVVTSDPTPANALPAGWQAFESGQPLPTSSNKPDANYNFGNNGSGNVGVWSYGSQATPGSDRALGGRVSPDISLVRVGAIFENGLSEAISSLDISYTGEQWQKGFNRATLVFEYSLDATSIVDGTWTSVSALDFLAPDTTPFTRSQFTVFGTNGNSSAFRTPVSGTIGGLSIGAGQTFGLRWSLNDIGGATTDDGLAIDDLQLTAAVAPVAAVPEPASWAMMIGGFGLIGGTLRRRRAIVSFA